MPRVPASPKNPHHRYGMHQSRRLPDTYNIEVVSSQRVPNKGAVNMEQFQFLKDVPEDLSPTGDPKTSRRLEGLAHLKDTAHLMIGENMSGPRLRQERYRG